MRLKELLIITRGTRVVLVITFTVSFLAVVFAFFHYRGINRSEDPRTEVARKLLAEYDRISGSIDSHSAFRLLDSAFFILNALPDYTGSFETGVIHNNKCSYLLMMSIYDSTLTTHEKEVCLDLALDFCDSSIACYRKWKHDWGYLSEDEINQKLGALIDEDHPAFEKVSFEKVFERRKKNILTARIETDRRLSVSLTNRGTIMRHMHEQDSALVYYAEALKLWDANRTAKSNLSVLLGGEPVKASLIESLFPPDKNQK